MRISCLVAESMVHKDIIAVSDPALPHLLDHTSPEEYGSMLKNVGSDAETPVVADVQPLE